VNLTANAGVQQNNLDHSKTSDAKRVVANINMGVAPNEHWMINGGYSNFSSFTRVRPLADPYFNTPQDTLDFYQVNNTCNGMLMYRTGNKEIQHAITLNASYQYASDKSSAQDATANLSKFLTSNVSYSYNVQPRSMSVTGSVNYYKSNASAISTTFMGPGVSVNKQHLEKTLRTGLSANYNVTKATAQVEGSSNVTNSSLFNTALNIGYSPKKKEQSRQGHNFGASVMWLLRGATGAQPGYNELTSTLNYTYSF
jgi:hypothetical protein